MYDEVRPAPTRPTEDSAPPRAPGAEHLTAWLFSRRLDVLLADRTPAQVGSALDLHASRITSVREREAVARTFRRCLSDVQRGWPMFTSRVPLNRENIVDAEDLIDRVTLWMHSPRPVTSDGMARLRLLLGDGLGPLYRYGRGDLTERLHSALAALART